MSTPIHGVAPELRRQITGSTREGSTPRHRGFMPHNFVTAKHFENIGRPNCQAQQHELFAPFEETAVYRRAYAVGDLEA